MGDRAEDKPWCHWQIRCAEDGAEGWTCIASLRCGKASACPHRTREEAAARCREYLPEGAG